MVDLRIGERGEEVIDYMTDHLGGLFDAVKEVLNFCLRTVYDALTTLTPLAMVVLLCLLALVATRRIGLTVVLGAGLLIIQSMDLWT
jgi:glycine betaine/proline transport system permease protein